MAAVAATLLAETRRRPGRLLLTGLAITVATVFAAGTFLLGETLRAYLAATVVTTPETTAAVVLPERMPEDARGADLVVRVAAVDGVADAVGVWAAYPTVSGAGSATTWHLASDPMDGPLTRLSGPLLQGRLPTGPDEVAVGETTAARTGLVPGRTVTVDAGDAAPRTVTVTGVVPLSDSELNTLVATPDTVAGLGGSLDQVDVAAGPGADAAALSGRIAAALGVPDAVRTGVEQRAAEVEDSSASVTAVLVGVGVFAGLAVVAGAVVVASTFRIVLTQRRTQMALLRCVGARRGQVVRAVLVEAVVTGLVAGVLGLGVALLAGYGLLAAMRASGAEGVPDLVVWWPGLAGVLLVTVVATVLAGLAPALAAARIPPVAALGVADAADAGVPRAGRRIVVAVVLAALAGALAGVALAMPGDGSLALVVVAFSGMVAFAALAVVGPVLVRGLVAVAGRPIAALGGAAARLAVANAAQVPRRTAATISVLALGVGLTSALLVGIQTTRAGAERNIAEQFPADVVVSAADAGSAASLAARLTADPRLAVRADGATVFVDPAAGRVRGRGPHGGRAGCGRHARGAGAVRGRRTGPAGLRARDGAVDRLRARRDDRARRRGGSGRHPDAVGDRADAGDRAAACGRAVPARRPVDGGLGGRAERGRRRRDRGCDRLGLRGARREGARPRRAGRRPCRSHRWRRSSWGSWWWRRWPRPCRRFARAGCHRSARCRRREG